MNDKYKFSDTFEIDRRLAQATDFYKRILEPDEYPLMVTDDASFYDIYMGGDNDAINKIYKEYDIEVTREILQMPFWKLLDLLYGDLSEFSTL